MCFLKTPFPSTNSLLGLLLLACSLASLRGDEAESPRPNIVLVMADDMGWGETGYYDHPVLRTPHLDAMAANGLRLDRFYAGAPVCSPTRASVLTGRTPVRTGVPLHGYALRLQERTIAEALKAAGYATAHFGKWHLDGLRGPGAPILASDTHHPGHFGFDEWLSTTNYFDIDPLLSRNGEVTAFQGDSSDVVMTEALAFMGREVEAKRPFFAVVWYGSPHRPSRALESDKTDFGALDEESANHYGELVALDRSVGALRRRLRELDIADTTLVIFCSDNGGLPGVTPSTTGGLRGFKASVYEGGLRVPAIVEWPAVITEPRVSARPACTVDLFPTIVDALDLSASVGLTPLDGESLLPLMRGVEKPRARPMGFQHEESRALIGRRFKLVSHDPALAEVELYDLVADPRETRNLAATRPEVAARLREQLQAWNASVDASVAGFDYPEGRVVPPIPPRVFWDTVPAYQRYLAEWRERWEYRWFLREGRKQRNAAAGKKP